MSFQYSIAVVTAVLVTLVAGRWFSSNRNSTEQSNAVYSGAGHWPDASWAPSKRKWLSANPPPPKRRCVRWTFPRSATLARR